MSKIKIAGMLKNITDNEINKFTTTAIKQKDKYKYLVNDEKYILTIITPNKIIMNRTNNEIEQTMYFEKNKTISSIYTLKENNITINIDVLTNEIELTENSIRILYTIIDSNISYEYNIEMSE